MKQLRISANAEDNKLDEIKEKLVELFGEGNVDIQVSDAKPKGSGATVSDVLWAEENHFQ